MRRQSCCVKIEIKGNKVVNMLKQKSKLYHKSHSLTGLE